MENVWKAGGNEALSSLSGMSREEKFEEALLQELEALEVANQDLQKRLEGGGWLLVSEHLAMQ